jgi:hypothetical protein
VLDERAPHTLAASGGPCSGDLDILVVLLQSAKWMPNTPIPVKIQCAGPDVEANLLYQQW